MSGLLYLALDGVGLVLVALYVLVGHVVYVRVILKLAHERGPLYLKVFALLLQLVDTLPVIQLLVLKASEYVVEVGSGLWLIISKCGWLLISLLPLVFG